MMNKDDNGQWVIHCDSCDEELQTETAEEEKAIEMAIHVWNWSMSGKDHLCEQCAEDEEDA